MKQSDRPLAHRAERNTYLLAVRQQIRAGAAVPRDREVTAIARQGQDVRLSLKPPPTVESGGNA
jgi:hypothetical protein